MDILKTATDWARAEAFSSAFFMLFGVLFLFSSISLWHFGKTEISKSYIIPTLIVGCLLLVIGGGLFTNNIMRLKKFEHTYSNDKQAFVESELTRTEKTVREYKTVLKVVPAIIILCALLIIFRDESSWRASSIVTIAMMTVILLIDTAAKNRIEDYNRKLLSAIEELPSHIKK